MLTCSTICAHRSIFHGQGSRLRLQIETTHDLRWCFGNPDFLLFGRNDKVQDPLETQDDATCDLQSDVLVDEGLYIPPRPILRLQIDSALPICDLSTSGRYLVNPRSGLDIANA